MGVLGRSAIIQDLLHWMLKLQWEFEERRKYVMSTEENKALARRELEEIFAAKGDLVAAAEI